MKRLAMTVFASLTPLMASAAPAILPTQDVSVHYSLTAPGQSPQDLELLYRAASESARINSDSGYYVLANLPAGQAQIVVPALHAVVQAPDFSALTAMLFLAESAQFTKLGQAHYAGLSCQKYRVVDKNGTATACITANGVTLHFTGADSHGAATLTATHVAYAPQPEEQFQTPVGFNQINLPASAIKALLTPQN